MHNNPIIARFKPGTWIDAWPHKVNLDDHLYIVEKLHARARAELTAEYCSFLQQPTFSSDKLMKWRYDFVHGLGNGAFLEIDKDSYYGWVILPDDAAVVMFILSYS